MHGGGHVAEFRRGPGRETVPAIVLGHAIKLGPGQGRGHAIEDRTAAARRPSSALSAGWAGTAPETVHSGPVIELGPAIGHGGRPGGRVRRGPGRETMAPSAR